MRNPIAKRAQSSETFLRVVLVKRGSVPCEKSSVNRWYAIIPGCLALYVTSPGYAANSALRLSPRPTGGEPSIPFLPPPVDPSESVLSEYTPQAPPDQKPPPYTLLRFNEDYRYLAEPRNRTDFFDQLKNISFNPNDPRTNLALGGGTRERYDHFPTPGSGAPVHPRTDDTLCQRF